MTEVALGEGDALILVAKVPADEVTRVAATASLHDEYCQVVMTAGLMEASAQIGRA
jgi:hypothetical protein